VCVCVCTWYKDRGKEDERERGGEGQKEGAWGVCFVDTEQVLHKSSVPSCGVCVLCTRGGQVRYPMENFFRRRGRETEKSGD